jgi:hypothetical protein
MRRTPKGVRHFLEISEVPHTAWARRLKISKNSLCLLVQGDARMQKGPAMQRLVILLDALDKGEWKWVRTGPRHLDKSWTWEGEPKELMPRRPTMTLNVLEGRIGWQP